MKTAFIGLGIMGSRMAANLQRSGHELLVYNRTPKKADALVEAGALPAATPAEAAADAEVVITMLAHPEAVTAAALGDEGLLTTARAGTVWIDCSTVHPSFSRATARAAAERGVRLIDAPVAGSKAQAEAAQLIFLVGAAEKEIEAVRPVFDAMGQRVVPLGAQGMGVALKVVVNHLLATSMGAFAEALVLGEALGLPRDMLLNALIGGPVAAPFLSGKAPKLAAGEYAAEFPLRWMHKDLQMTATAAYESGVAMPVSHATKELYQLAMRQGYGDLDFSAIFDFLANDMEGG